MSTSPQPVPAVQLKSRLVSERTFHRTVSIIRLMKFLHECRKTGVLTIDLSQGGVNMIRFREEENVTSP